MKQMIFTIYDNVACECGGLMTVKNEGIAKRMFSDAVNKSLRKQPNINLIDYSLVKIGEFDSETLDVVPCARQIIQYANEVPDYTDVEDDMGTAPVIQGGK